MGARLDVLEELFAGTGGEELQGLEELHALIHLCADPHKAPGAASAKKTVRQLAKTRKATHYLRTDIYQKLDAASRAMKAMAPQGVRTSKSRLVNLALERLLEDFRRHGDAQSLARLLEEES